MIPDLPWFAWAFGYLFWGLVGLRWWTRRRFGRVDDVDQAHGPDDGPRWAPRGGGF